MNPDQVRAILLALAIGGALAAQQPSSPVEELGDDQTSRPAANNNPISTVLARLREQSAINTHKLQATTTPLPVTSTNQADLISGRPVSDQWQESTQSATTTTRSSVPNSSSSKPEESQEFTSQPASDATSQALFQFVRPQSAPKCSHNNQTYSIGQRWNDDCIQVCECVLADESSPIAVSACRPRCPMYKDTPGENCILQRSKSDECCLEWQCQLDAKLAGASSLPTTSTTLTNTSERGQLSLSTTEVRMPAASSSTTSTSTSTTSTTTSTSTTSTTTTPAPQTTAAPTSARPTSTTALPATTLPAITTTIQSRLAAQQLYQKALSSSSTTSTPAPTTSTQRQPVTSLSSSPGLTTRRMPAVSPSGPASSTSASPSAGSRAPKQVAASARPSSTSRPLSSTSTRAPTTTSTQAPSTGSSFVTLQPLSSTLESSTSASTSEEVVNPFEVDLCIVDRQGETAYKVDQDWFDSDCLQTCRCAFRSEARNASTDFIILPTVNLRDEETEIRCNMPAHCEAELQQELVPGPNCRNPSFVLPQLNIARCACPRVTCLPEPAVVETTMPSTLAPPQTSTQPQTTSTQAQYQPKQRPQPTPPVPEVRAPSKTEQPSQAEPRPQQPLQAQVQPETQQQPTQQQPQPQPVRECAPNAERSFGEIQFLDASIQRYAVHLLVAFSIMTVLFIIVSYLYLKKSSRVIAPITSQSAYDNPTFTKLVSYYANQPHALLVDENSQNYNNDVILAKQKNSEVDKASPLHHQLHLNGRQQLV